MNEKMIWSQVEIIELNQNWEAKAIKSGVETCFILKQVRSGRNFPRSNKQLQTSVVYQRRRNVKRKHYKYLLSYVKLNGCTHGRWNTQA